MLEQTTQPVHVPPGAGDTVFLLGDNVTRGEAVETAATRPTLDARSEYVNRSHGRGPVIGGRFAGTRSRARGRRDSLSRVEVLLRSLAAPFAMRSGASRVA